jgi:hypothetical protein
VSIGKDEGCRLAGAGLGDAEDIAAFEHVRDRTRLDRGGIAIASGLNRRENLLAQSECCEAHVTGNV